MELPILSRRRREKFVDKRVAEASCVVMRSIFEYVDEEATGPLNVPVGKTPKRTDPTSFAKEIASKAEKNLERRTPFYAGKLALDPDLTLEASLETVREDSVVIRSEREPASGATLVFVPVEMNSTPLDHGNTNF